MSAIALVAASFVAMEAVSYAAHRWIMHGFGWGWHRSHHLPPGPSRFERNDLFPLCFSAVGILLFAWGTVGAARDLLSVAMGITAYGAVYLAVHEVYIHRRLPVRLPPIGYLEWLRAAHRDHHRRGAEPYGMLLPLVRDRAAAPSERVPLERSASAARLASTPRTRARL